MILHPGILALIGGSTIVALMAIYVSLLGIRIALRWDFSSSSAYQLNLERSTYLLSMIMNYVLGFQIASFLLFIYTIDDIHKLFVGAMCATGSLNANPVGWYALISKIVVFFFSGLWIAMNHVDQKVESYPLVRLKYILLLLLLPIIVFDLFFQVQYFLGLNPDIITSCCGSLFSDSGTGVASTLSALPVLTTMKVFYVGTAILFLASLVCLFSRAGFMRYIYSASTLGFFFVALAAIVSFVSIYIYELPMHHCPFDIFQGHYNFIGYPLYISLFCGTFFGILPGVFQPLKTIFSLRETIALVERKWIFSSLAFLSFFAFLTIYSITSSNLRLFEP